MGVVSRQIIASIVESKRWMDLTEICTKQLLTDDRHEHRHERIEKEGIMLILLNSDPTVTISVDLFTVCLLLASLLFGFTLILTKRKYDVLKRSDPTFDIKKLLVLSAGTVCFLRIMSFVGVMAMDVANVRAHYTLNPASRSSRKDPIGGASAAGSSEPIERNQSFYDSSMTVLFDLPNAIVISTYVLLTLVWAECSLLSRFHTESSIAWRKRWLLWYMIFNSLVYSTQIVVYILIFGVGGEEESYGVAIVRNVVNVAMAGVNLMAVFMVLLLFLYLNFSFSGFPFRSRNSKEGLRRITNVVTYWSVSRIIWGLSTLTLYIHDVDLLRPSSGWWSPMILLLLLVACEISPIIVLMDYSFMTIFEFADVATREMSSLALGRHSLMASTSDGRVEGDDPGGNADNLRDSREPLLGHHVVS